MARHESWHLSGGTYADSQCRIAPSANDALCSITHYRTPYPPHYQPPKHSGSNEGSSERTEASKSQIDIAAAGSSLCYSTFGYNRDHGVSLSSQASKSPFRLPQTHFVPTKFIHLQLSRVTPTLLLLLPSELPFIHAQPTLQK